jgi:2,3-dihydroxybenzoate decarboxylase
MSGKGTIAIEEACLHPGGIEQHAKTSSFFSPGTDFSTHPLTQALLDIHGDRLARMDAAGVDYMLLSLTANGPQGEPDAARAAAMAREANDWLAAQARREPRRFGALASLAMHDAAAAAAELTRAVTELGMFGAILNDYQEVVVGEGGGGDGKVYYDADEYDVFWKTVEELGVPVYLHPRYPAPGDLAEGSKYGPRHRHLLGAAVQFHLDLSFHVYAIMSSGIFDRYPKVQVVIGHLGEG